MTINNSIRTNESVLKKNSRPVPFDYIPADHSYLFCVPAGVDPEVASSKAWALESAVKDVLESGVKSGLDVNLAFLCRLAMDAAIALREAVVTPLPSSGKARALETAVRDVLNGGVELGVDGSLALICHSAMSTAIASMEAHGEAP